MNKMNKKGFTLIEMLVVIAIIAVLVSIIIPVVTNSTDKAAAATNAANLRSLKAEAVTAMLSHTTETTNLKLTYDANGKLTKIEPQDAAPKSKAVLSDVAKDQPALFSAIDANGDFSITYGGKDVTYFAAVAETGKAPANGAGAGNAGAGDAAAGENNG